MRRILFIATWFFLAPGFPVAQPMTTGSDFLLMTTGARPDAMGQAFSAVADDLNTLSFNPAGLGNIRMPEIGYSHQRFVADIRYDFVGCAVPLGRFGVLGLGYVSMGVPPFNSTGDPSAGQVSALENAGILGWGRAFSWLQAGGSVKYISRRVSDWRGYSMAGDFGLRVRDIPGRISLALSVQNMGSGIDMVEREDLATVARAGAACRILDFQRHSVDVATEYTYPLNGGRSLSGGGLEYWYSSVYALRGGYVFGSEEEGLSAGLGIRIGAFQVDYAYQPYRRIGESHRISGLLRWEGAWISGTEPGASRLVKVNPTALGMKLTWVEPSGIAEAYEVEVRSSRGREAVTFRVKEGEWMMPSIDDGVLYRARITTIGRGGARSRPSRPVEFSSAGLQEVQVFRPEPAQGTWSGEIPSNAAVYGRVDAVGLHLSWKTPREKGVTGYHLYRRKPVIGLVRVNRLPIPTRDVWVVEVFGDRTVEWVVTAIVAKGREVPVGSWTWIPTPGDLDLLDKEPLSRLNSSPQPEGKIFLDWSRLPEIGRYSLFYAEKDETVFYYFGDLKGYHPCAYIQIVSRTSGYQFLVAPKGKDGRWLNRTTVTGVNQLLK